MRLLIAIPAFNEAPALEANVRRLRRFCDERMVGVECVIVIADNASTDATPEIAARLARELSGVRHLCLEKKGKGLAIRRAWQSETAEVYAFIDADLSAELEALPEIVKRFVEGADLVVGSRTLPGSIAVRRKRRRLYSLGYRLFLRLALGLRLGDASCGCKAVSRRVVEAVVSKINDERWFFDTELVVRAMRAGFRVVEIPVHWNDQRERRSKVSPATVALEYMRAVWRLRRELSRSKG